MSSAKFGMYASKQLIEEIDRAAKQYSISRNRLIRIAIRRLLDDIHKGRFEYDKSHFAKLD